MSPSIKSSFPKEKINVVLLESVHARGVSLFKEDGFNVHTEAASPDAKKLAELVKNAHILGVRSKTLVTKEILAQAPKLLAVGCFCIGTDQVDLSDAGGKGVPVFNSPFSNTRSVAELTIAEIIALHRRMIDQSAMMHTGGWDKSAAGCHEVRGRTLGIVGYGHIGSQVSVMAEAMGMRVMYFDIIPKLPLGNARQVRSLKEMLEACDVLTLHVPATEQTKKMIGPAQLKMMKPGSFVINNARGSVVDVPALAGAIKSGHIAGAALDVFPKEPAGKAEKFESELCGLKNVILTPHVGGSTEEAQEAIAEDVASKLLNFVNKGSTTGAVNVPQVDLPDQTQERSGTQARVHRILHFHRNVPGVLSKMHQAIAGKGVNVNAEYLRTNADVGYVVLDIDPSESGKGEKQIVEELRAMPETVRVRVLW